MGTIKQGILGGFSGKVGTVVGASWKGISYMRGQAQHVKNPRTAAQTYNRAALRAITDALRPIATTLQITFAKSAGKMSAFNKAVQINYKKAIINQDGQPVVDYSKLVLSKGNIKPFSTLFIEDMDHNGDYLLSTIEDPTCPFIYEGLIFFIYDVADATWYSGVVIEQYEAGDTLECTGVPLLRNKEYLAFACAYDPSSGQVSNPISRVEIMSD